MSSNWVDWVIIVVVLYYLIQGWRAGLVHLIAHLASFVASLFLAVRFHQPVGSFFAETFGIAPTWTTAMGFIFVAFVSEAFLSHALGILTHRLPKKFTASSINRLLGTVVSALNGLAFITFFLIILLALPLRGTVKQDIRGSSLGVFLVSTTERFAGPIKSTVDQAAKDAMKFLTVKPKSTERILLDIAPNQSDLSRDEASEQTMITRVNTARTSAGVPALVQDKKMTAVARSHSRDMFERRYFSHIDQEGHDAGFRMQEADIAYRVVGENLAYAPDVETAHQGLIESAEHRRNMLDGQFRRVGIGVVDGGIYGKMFTQIFAD